MRGLAYISLKIYLEDVSNFKTLESLDAIKYFSLNLNQKNALETPKAKSRTHFRLSEFDKLV